jgi:hypothetical protein
LDAAGGGGARGDLNANRYEITSSWTIFCDAVIDHSNVRGFSSPVLAVILLSTLLLCDSDVKRSPALVKPVFNYLLAFIILVLYFSAFLLYAAEYHSCLQRNKENSSSTWLNNYHCVL